MINPVVFQFAMLVYLLSSILYIVHLGIKREALGKAADWIALSGLATNVTAMVIRYVESHQSGFGYVPFSNMYESMAFLAAAIVGCHLFLVKIYQTRTLGAFIMPLGFFAMGIAVFALSPAIKPLMPALQSDWLFYHVVTSMLGYAAFTVSFGVSIVYLVKRTRQEKKGSLPDRKALEDINYRAITVGFLLFTVGIVTGAIWAYYAWGTYWSWDPKETWSLITWIVYAILLHTRYTGRLAGRRMAYVSVVGFASVIFTYWGVNYLLTGLHSYAG